MTHEIDVNYLFLEVDDNFTINRYDYELDVDAVTLT